jgi:hypothetical protein
MELVNIIKGLRLSMFISPNFGRFCKVNATSVLRQALVHLRFFKTKTRCVEVWGNPSAAEV